MTADRRRKTAASKSSASKTPAKSTRKSPAKKAATSPDDVNDEGQAPRQARRRASAPRAESQPKASAKEVARTAAHELTELTGKAAEAITGIERVDDGWRVTVEVLEVRRIPETTDVLARYEIEADSKGSLTSYRRAGRFTRGSTQED